MRAFNLLLIVIVVFALSFGSFAQTIEQPSAYYSLDTISADSTGKSPVTDTDSILGKSGRFDGVNDYIHAGDYIGEQKSYTVSLWFKTSSTEIGKRIFQRGKANACFYDPAISLDGGKLTVSESGCSSAGRIGGKLYSGIPITLGEWNHVVVVRDEDTVQVYLNGKLKITDNDQPTPSLGTDGKVTIGASWGSRSTYSSFFPGLIDEIKIWNRPFTVLEVQSLYSTQKNAQLQSSTQTPSASTTPISSDLSSPSPLAIQQSTGGGGSGVQISGDVPTIPSGGGSSISIAGPSITIPSGGASSVSLSGSTPKELEISPFGIITTFAGAGGSGSSGDGGLASQAKFNSPKGIIFDSSGNLYIADTGNHKIRKIFAQDIDANNDGTPDFRKGYIYTIAGTGTAGPLGDGGPAVQAQLSSPTKIGIDNQGNIYISDTGNNKIRKLTPSTASPGTYTISTLSSAIPPEVKKGIDAPGKKTKDDFGNVYIADGFVTGPIDRGDRITVKGITVAGEEFDVLGNPASGYKKLAAPQNIPTDFYYSGRRTTVYGSSQESDVGDGSLFYGKVRAEAVDVVFDSSYNMYIADKFTNRIRKIDSRTQLISTVAGNSKKNQYYNDATGWWTGGFGGDNGMAGKALLNRPEGVAIDPSGNLYIADTLNNRIRKVELSDVRLPNIIKTTAGTGEACATSDSQYWPPCNIGGPATEAKLNSPQNVVADSHGNTYIIDYFYGGPILAKTVSYRLYKIDASGTITQLLGEADKVGSSLAVDNLGNNIIFSTGGQIRKMDAKTNIITTITGIGSVSFIDKQNNIYFIASGEVHKMDSTGKITKIAGTGIGCPDPRQDCGDFGPALQAKVSPSGLVVDSSGNVYIAEYLASFSSIGSTGRIRKIDFATKTILPFAGLKGPSSDSGFIGDGGPASDAPVSPTDIDIDPDGNIYIADNGDIRKIDAKTNTISTIAGSGLKLIYGQGEIGRAHV